LRPATFIIIDDNSLTPTGLPLLWRASLVFGTYVFLISEGTKFCRRIFADLCLVTENISA
jgi:hypothetical protein